jgi:AcrR family transcriptional regulator
MNMNEDGQRARSVATQHALMNAAEKLIAEKGIQNVTKREIVKAAGQKNESVLQYHFQNLEGLLKAIQQSRATQTQEKREEMLDQLLALTQKPTLRDICKIMVLPPFLLSKKDPGYCRYLSAFSLEPALAATSALSLVKRKGAGGDSGKETGKLLRKILAHLEEDAYLRRMDSAIRLASVSMSHHARQKDAFRSTESDLFIYSLIDAITGLLSAPVSEETAASFKEFASGKK